jgi:hypothetical protein
MAFNNEIKKVKSQIKVLEKKLSFLEELEKTKLPKSPTLYDLIADWWDEIFMNNNEAAVTIESLVDDIEKWLPKEHDTNSYKWNQCIRTIKEKLR